MKAFWESAREELEQGRPVFVAFVASSSRGSPGTPQARLLLKQDASQLGTIGGGIMECRLIEYAIRKLENGLLLPELQELAHNPAAQNNSGLICGGSQNNVIAILSPQEHLQTVHTVCKTLRADGDGQLEISPQGLRFHSSPPSQNSCFEVYGNTWTYRFSLFNSKRIAIFGAGHCGQALAQQMLQLGYHVTLVEQRTAIEPSSRILESTTYLNESPRSACAKLRKWKHTAVIVMTHSFPTDLQALLEILPNQPAFLGLMGSPPKLKRIFNDLRAQGIEEEQLKTLRAPVGLAIGSDTPEEIAISIAAQLIQERSALTLKAHKYANQPAA